MSRTSLKQQLMREQMVQQERKEALQRQQQLQKLQTNSRLTPHHLNIGSTVNNTNNNNNNNNNNNHNNNANSNSANVSSVIAITGTGLIGDHRRNLGHLKISEAASCPNFFTDAFTNSNTDNGPNSGPNIPTGSSSSSSTLITNSTTTSSPNNNVTYSKASNRHNTSHHHATSSLINNANGSGPQSPFPLSPDSPLSGPRSSASELDDEYWQDVQRTLVLDMDLMDQNGNVNDNGSGECGVSGNMGSEHVASNSINVIHHHSHHQSHQSPMDPSSLTFASTLPADIGYSFNPHQIYAGEDSQQSNSHLSDVTKMSSSCPPLSTSCPPLSSDAEFSAWERERKKKDAHNKIERRRRYNINDRIKELSTLLPTQDETHYDLVKDMKQNKGTILKASVDFLRTLKRDVTRIPELERQKRELEMDNRKMSMRIQQLEQDLRRKALIGEEQHVLYKPDHSAPKSIQFGQQHHHHGHSSHHGTPTPPPHPQSLPHHISHGFHHTPETDYWINESITLDDNSIGHGGSLQNHSQHMTSGSLDHQSSTDINSDLIDTIYGSSRMSTHHHPIIKQEYNVSPSQSSSGLGSLSSPTSLSSPFLPQLSQMLINDNTSKDTLGVASPHVKGELPSPQVMDVCD